MSDIAFDPYHKWLGIPPGARPPNHYELLGIAPLESDRDVIVYNTDRQLLALRSLQQGLHADMAARISAEISAASACLLAAEDKKRYDLGLCRVVKLPRPGDSNSVMPPLPPPVAESALASAARDGDGAQSMLPLIARPPVRRRLRRRLSKRKRDRMMSRKR